MNQNVVITIQTITGASNDKDFTSRDTLVRAFIAPASTETLALYPDVPSGKLYEYQVIDEVASIPPGSKLLVTDDLNSVFSISDSFLTVGESRLFKRLGRTNQTGLCYIPA